ncbi:endoplasmic reticulum vesicle transporter-domain-containing protein [Chaetomium sp. MPI-SDFR-AT-0129]|uniref:Endoplasmic reticulum-Golgi intermediate compartment protein n=1 Tax=Dichotomopilus funicola TaxID=1934379 RepID=A0AAN6UYT2_9PEZI|nr:endoplasmic reticulum vesicle transporter-domain-containing protein [Chaetomium sp. MPI-SDFR-AT-0129]KAK4141565.1 endoplasmic reticulum vesicle transporter-domain-containing protein [Dichotomopilus funicola]
MATRSRFTRLDAFTKTVEDARIRTTSGGVVTIVSLIVVFFLAWGEWADYRRIEVHPELIVDKSRGERMEIHLNITFPRIPCELLTLDVMDVSGEQQHGVHHGVSKTRLRPLSEGGGDIDSKAITLHDATEAAIHLSPDYCGPCYGAAPPGNAQKAGCCNTCDEVKEAYAQAAWAFGRGEGIEQCEREHYSEKLDEQRNEGCRIEGALRVNKVVGNFHIAPGRSFSKGNMHVHDLNNYWNTPTKHTFTHTIHQLRFGPQLPDSLSQKLGSKNLPWTNHHLNPLDGTNQQTDDVNYNFMYFLKIVPTSYLPLGWEKSWSGFRDRHSAELGAFGASPDGSVETHQYSVTSHKRSLTGGDDSAEGHKERLHSRGGIPGVFFSYDISPMKVINREEKAKSFLGFLAGLCAIVGGTLTVAAAIDRALFEGGVRLKKMRSKDL